MEQETERTPSFFRFEDLRVYDKSLDYMEWVFNTTRLFPGDEAKSLTQGFNSAAMAVSLNIAEGSARNKTQFIYYLKVAKSAVRECVVYTTIADKQGLLTEDQVEESRNTLMEMTKMIGALIGSLQKSNAKKKSQQRSEVEVEY